MPSHFAAPDGPQPDLISFGSVMRGPLSAWPEASALLDEASIGDDADITSKRLEGMNDASKCRGSRFFGANFGRGGGFPQLRSGVADIWKTKTTSRLHSFGSKRESRERRMTLRTRLGQDGRTRLGSCSLVLVRFHDTRFKDILPFPGGNSETFQHIPVRGECEEERLLNGYSW